MAWPTQQGAFDAGDIVLQNGARLPSARLSWKTHGTLSPARDNVIVYPTSYGARHPDLEWLIGPDKILDPEHWFIVIPDMFGNGLSSSPSNTPDYPTLVTVYDNVQVQRHALKALFGIDRIACVYGWSMGALQAYHWTALFPAAVERIVVNCGAATTSVHNQVFVRSLMAVLEAAPQHIGNGRFSAEPHAAKRAFGRIYASWALSQDFYRAGLHLADGPAPNLGAPDLETFLKTGWEDRFGAWPAADLYAQLRTWDAADIGGIPGAKLGIQIRGRPGAEPVFPAGFQEGFQVGGAQIRCRPVRQMQSGAIKILTERPARVNAPERAFRGMRFGGEASIADVLRRRFQHSHQRPHKHLIMHRCGRRAAVHDDPLHRRRKQRRPVIGL